MNQDEIRSAILAQEEYIKRTASCLGQVGLPHTWDNVAAGPGAYYQACRRCEVTRTVEDYAVRIGSEG